MQYSACYEATLLMHYLLIYSFIRCLPFTRGHCRKSVPATITTFRLHKVKRCLESQCYKSKHIACGT
uniref:Uncharacterized protein n=1 Tax=Rhipicephalus pulchellus TaxID=72859 RepID=L7M0T5_RHIPC